ncbi:MAG: hypothetical protein K0R26_539 [Bacteroidota bacterium]|jgi:hypothetical protein|nr:hypothetical protein [Bacteroidota bacterium]
MKNLLNKSLFAIGAGLLLSYNSIAHNFEAPTKVSLSETSKFISEQIKFPTPILQTGETEKVNVVFTVNELGEVNLVVANTGNKLLKKSIESQFMKLKLNHLIADNAYSVVFNFKTV